MIVSERLSRGSPRDKEVDMQHQSIAPGAARRLHLGLLRNEPLRQASARRACRGQPAVSPGARPVIYAL